MLKAVLLIAGTTVGGGFLALPGSVVLPLGGFLPAAVSLAMAWLYLLVQSLVLAQCLVQCHKDKGPNVSASEDMIGFPRVAQQTLGPQGATIATFSLVLLTQATLVSQLSRAGILLADNNSILSATSPLIRYRMGCFLAAALGTAVCFKGWSTVKNALHEGMNRSSATTLNAALTGIFLISVVLLFQAGQTQAIWSRCWSTPPTTGVASVANVAPIMLQLLVYGEILPNVCHMLGYNPRHIRFCVALGSFIPLVLLTGWAALGVALVPPTSSTMTDPVRVLLQGNGGISSRLLVLSLSAIGTTILGSLLALSSAYQDVTNLRRMKKGSDVVWQRPWIAIACIALPPTLVAAISPSLFLQAIDFAGSYPILLLYGVLPSFMALKLNTKRRKRYIGLAAFSGAMVTANFVADVKEFLLWLASRLS